MMRPPRAERCRPPRFSRQLAERPSGHQNFGELTESGATEHDLDVPIECEANSLERRALGDECGQEDIRVEDGPDQVDACPRYSAIARVTSSSVMPAAFASFRKAARTDDGDLRARTVYLGQRSYT